jgi:hypothetical protein
MRSDLRKDVEEARRVFRIPEADFSPLPFTTGWHHECYLINKKYEWLLSVNHHDNLTGTGAFIIGQLKSVAQRSPEMLIAAYPA